MSGVKQAAHARGAQPSCEIQAPTDYTSRTGLANQVAKTGAKGRIWSPASVLGLKAQQPASLAFVVVLLILS